MRTDPNLNDNTEAAKLLGDFLRKNLVQAKSAATYGTFLAGPKSTYKLKKGVDYGEEGKKFKLTHAIHLMRREDGGLHYIVVANDGKNSIYKNGEFRKPKGELGQRRIMGAGSFTKVYKLAGEIKLSDGGNASFKPYESPEEKSVLRRTKFNNNNNPNLKLAENAYELSKDINPSYTKGKLLVYKKNPNLHLVQERKIPGRPLEDIIKEDITKYNSNKLTTEQRLALSIALFEALQTQIHGRGIIHRDIKPANIMVKFPKNGGKPIVNIIDFNLSKRKGKKIDTEKVGTEGYIAPEVYANQPTTEKSDVFAMTQVLDDIWDSETPDSLPLRGLKETHKSKILSAIKAGTQDKPNSRWSSQKMLSVLKQVEQERVKQPLARHESAGQERNFLLQSLWNTIKANPKKAALTIGGIVLSVGFIVLSIFFPPVAVALPWVLPQVSAMISSFAASFGIAGTVGCIIGGAIVGTLPTWLVKLGEDAVSAVKQYKSVEQSDETKTVTSTTNATTFADGGFMERVTQFVPGTPAPAPQGQGENQGELNDNNSYTSPAFGS